MRIATGMLVTRPVVSHPDRSTLTTDSTIAARRAASLSIRYHQKQKMKTYPVEQAVRAQKALRQAAGLGPEMFPIQAFVGMISDEIEQLRLQGKTDEQIAALIAGNSNIEITASEISEHYAPSEERRFSH